jgi:hypothetical protein
MSHIGRSFGGPGHLEATCPCALAPCGLVDTENVSDECDQHPPMRCKTMRTGHPAENCPGVGRAVVIAMRATEIARQVLIDAAASGEPAGWVGGGFFDAVDAFRAAVEHEAAERIRDETALLKAHGVLEPDKYRPCRDAADQIDPEVHE